ncbi:MAG: hypothetical protein ACYS6W_12855 [Planctomycetota bacterium]|jgi:hypothetical protein
MIAIHKRNKVIATLLTRNGRMDTNRGDISYWDGDVLIRKAGTRDQYAISPVTFMANYDPETPDELDEFIAYWDAHGIRYK